MIGPKEKAIREFAKAMRSANETHCATGRFTPKMQVAWDAFVEACTYTNKEKHDEKYDLFGYHKPFNLFCPNACCRSKKL